DGTTTRATIYDFTYTDVDLVLATIKAVRPGTYPYTISIFDGDKLLVKSNTANLTVNPLTLTAKDVTLTAGVAESNVDIISGIISGAYVEDYLSAVIEVTGNPVLKNVTHTVLGTINFTYNGTDKTTATIFPFTYVDLPFILATITADNADTYTYKITLLNGTTVVGESNSATLLVNEKPTPTFTGITTEYCSGATIPALPTESDNGIFGTWSPPINNTATTEYTFTPNSGQIANTATITITIVPNVTPTFINLVTEYCSGSLTPALPTKSDNDITGTWSPEMSNTETKEYTFTPNSGQCANTTTVTITITPMVTPIFTGIVTDYYAGEAIPELPTESDNGVFGTWTPAINNMATTTYTFMPYSGQCAFPTTITITVIANYTITATAGANGYIDPVGIIPVNPGENQPFTFAANTGYEIDQVFVDGAPRSDLIAAGAYTFLDVKENHTIAVTFKSLTPGLCPDQVYDAINNIVYNVVEVAGLCWTKENLRGTKYPDGSEIPFAKPYLYMGNPVDVEVFGLLYDYLSATLIQDEYVHLLTCAAQGICPTGWHIPTMEEWNLLKNYEAAQLMSTQYWLDPPGPGSDDFGFTAHPAGFYNGVVNRFEALYGFTGWWASAAPVGESAHYYSLYYYCSALQDELMKRSNGLSVRCVKDY
ncbi:MAG: fibrobacter succinogenes major paralogous domain-containing protein, partial [Bacteroidales bacterium]|nr:fibrobacter succinogenes major paralogous domain-containing protein [Bacteroidales bacterium]